MTTQPGKRTAPVGPAPQKPSVWRRYGAWAFGVLLLGALVATVLHMGEIEHFATLASTAEPGWLLLALAAQACTYASAAACWWVTARAGAWPLRFWSLVPLSLAKLFTDQAVPTGGISGAMLVIGGLRRRGVPLPMTLATMLVSLVSYYAAYFLAAATSLAILLWHHAASPALWGTTAVFLIVAPAITITVFWFQRRGTRLPGWVLTRFPGLAALTTDARPVRTDLLRRPGLLVLATVLQCVVFLCDALTFWAVFQALGQPAPFWATFAAFVTASLAATLGPVPLGLGTFEAAAVAMLAHLGIGVETALAATLLLRGFTFWLPMIPGLWLARREIAAAPRG